MNYSHYIKQAKFIEYISSHEEVKALDIHSEGITDHLLDISKRLVGSSNVAKVTAQAATRLSEGDMKLIVGEIAKDKKLMQKIFNEILRRMQK